MAKISTYPIDSSVSLADYVIGTDAEDSNITKNYTIGSLFAISSGHVNGYSTTPTTTTFTAADTYVVLANVYTEASASKWTAATNRLTYTGTTPATTNAFLITFVVSTRNALSDLTFLIYKNGVALADTEQGTATTENNNISIQTIQNATTSDYFQVFVKSSAIGSVVCNSINATVVAVR